VNIAINDIPLKLDSLRYISLAECVGASSTTFTQWALKATESGEIRQTTWPPTTPFKVIQGRRLVPIERPHAISY